MHFSTIWQLLNIFLGIAFIIFIISIVNKYKTRNRNLEAKLKEYDETLKRIEEKINSNNS